MKSKILSSLFFFGFVAFFLTGSPTWGIVPELKPIPDKAAQSKAEDRLRKALGSNFDRPKDSELPFLTKELLKLVDETSDEEPALLYVILNRSAELLSANGEYQKSLDTVDRLAAEFKVKEGELKRQLIKKASRKVKTRVKANSLSEVALSLVQKKIDQYEFDIAEKVLQDTRSLVRKTKNSILSDAHSFLRDDVRRLKPAYKEVQRQFEILEKNPENSICKVAVGQFLCFHKYDWERGLSLLSSSADEEFADLAKTDLNNPIEANEIIKLAKRWEDLSNLHKKNKAWKESMKLRAFHWYVRSLSELSGLKRVELSQRLAEMSLPAPTTIVLYNQHNGVGNNTGSSRCNVSLYSGKKKVWERKAINMKWEDHKDPPTFVQIPDISFDRIRVEITHRPPGKTSGGLSELEVLARGINIIRNCQAVASAEHVPNDPRHANNVTDGIKTSVDELVGYWLLPVDRRGWADVFLKKWK